MNDYDPADLDGDGEFDGIDIAFLEEENKSPGSKDNSGCLTFFVIGVAMGSAILAAHLNIV